jgi:actin-related protein
MYIPQGFNHMYGIPLIMEVGSLNTKIGFAGKERPDLVAPSVPPSTLSTFRSTAPMVKRLN